ncbi:LLM class flavin-dependent oxidoreductase [Conexibacter sp. CPCC 206217]|uniref:LLM class flavin-dependent oxidoreductase n=1 Tax=Conexibacter sp. CPCC 206217 TaxID=3064574 RepID=UPI002723C83E|nr:LLM class flavin-dependent oxidoreductase [Conexibacter sp. CPCC 206217]MDO8212146.1 LLM class flavin-dependent oxidoreductase [Conexibacter sp. CPCC 206217]
MSRQILVNAFAMNTPTHLVSGTWRDPDSQSWRYKDLAFWTDLVQHLERGLFDGLFIADVLGIYDVYGGGPEAALRGGVQVPVNDPLLLVSAMAHVTEHLGFGVTASTTFDHPYTLARRFSTLDHLTRGRIGWNVVTSYLNSGARNIGLDRQLGHDERYDVADEYLEVAYKLWEGSWEDDAVVRDLDRHVFADPAKIHPIGHEGKHFRVPGIHLAEPSPQRTPVLYQAGASGRGRAFAGQHAEAVFLAVPTEAIGAARVADIRARAVAAGRDARDVKVFSSYTVVVAETDAEAHRKHDLYRSYLEPEATLALWSGWTGFDMASYDPDEPLRLVPSDAVHSTAELLGNGDWTVRDLVEQAAGLRPGGAFAVGSPATVADRIQEWVEAIDADGLNLCNVITPGSYVDFVDLVVPELQRRGVYRTSYDEGTLRRKLFGRGDRLPDTHPAARHRADVSRQSAVPAR